MDGRPWHAHYDSEVSPSLEFEIQPLARYLEQGMQRYAERPAIIFQGVTTSYAELGAQVQAFAAGLTKLGVTKGTRIAIQMPNLPQAVIAFYGAMWVGAQVVMTNPLYTAREIEHQWTDSNCEVVVTTDFLYHKVAGVRDRVPIKHVIVASIPDALPWYLRIPARWKLKRQTPPLVADVPAASDVHRFADIVATGATAAMADVSPEDVAVVQYTGGTTGVSKGAMLTHGNISANIQQLRAWLHIVEPGKEVILAALPFFHVFGLSVCINFSVSVGAAIAIVPNPRDTGAMIGVIAKNRVSILPAVPAMFHAINTHPGIDSVDITSVKGCFSGSAPLPTDTARRFQELTGATIIEGFGLTETSPVTHCNPFGGRKKEGSIGMPVSQTDCRIVGIDDPNTEVEPGSEGELLIRGPQVMAGYLGRDDETANCLRDGWLHTGDLAVMDEDGYFAIVGRKKDMIVTGGYNVYPDEVDDVLMEHDAVDEACTIGLPDRRLGETVKAFVVLCKGKTVSDKELRAWCKERLAAYKVPRAIEFRESLPKSAMMKTLRRELRDEEMTKEGAAKEG